MTNTTIRVAIVSKASHDTQLYKKLIEKFGAEVSFAGDYDSFASSTALSDALLFDISTPDDLAFVANHSKLPAQSIILLSPYTHNEIPNRIKEAAYLSKPLKFDKLKKSLTEIKVNLFRSRYFNQKEQVLHALVDESPQRMAVYNREGILIYANSAYLKANAIEDLHETLSFEHMTRCKVGFHEILFELTQNNIYVSQQQQEHEWFKSFFYLIKNKHYIAHLCTNITDTYLELETLKKEALFFRHTSEGVIITDDKGIAESVNDAFCSITGYTKEEILRKSTNLLASGIHTKDFYEHLWDSLKHYGKWQGEIWNRRKNGEVYPEWLSIAKTVDPSSNKTNYLALFTDISSIKDADEKIRFYANHDHLTGLLNKVQFENMLKQSITSAKRNNTQFALMFLDLDHFKEINDTYGHNVGDILLKTVASRFLKILRKEDIVARIGGDEFNIIIQNVKAQDDVVMVANKLIDSVKELIVIEGHECRVTLSIGIALFPLHGDNEIDLVKYADSAMYEVKNAGRDGVQIYNAQFSDALIKKVSLQNDLKRAISQDDIEIYFQPVFDRKNKIVGAEVLARWQHITRGFVPPDEFIQIAEEYGIILHLGKILLQKIFEKLPIILSKVSSDFKVAINISGREFFDSNFVENFLAMVDDFALSPINIELEITETYIMQNVQKAIENMNKLQQKGFSIAIDDFGTGYSSLNYLKLFPISKLKIDKTFVLDALNDSDDCAIVQSIIQLAKIFKLSVQAEGVETKEHFDLLMRLGCDTFQGYYCAKPLAFEALMEFLGESHAL
ncbi:MAG: EAL domain-containing protein [Campylobacterales bacterium]|nr:EAL domain-containing protein [Campylobacterales bacterium]